MKRFLLSLLVIMAGMGAFAQSTFVVDDVTYTIKEGTMKYKFKIQQYQTDAVESTVSVFSIVEFN